jgi:hypothetical protein
MERSERRTPEEETRVDATVVTVMGIRPFPFIGHLIKQPLWCFVIIKAWNYSVGITTCLLLVSSVIIMPYVTTAPLSRHKNYSWVSTRDWLLSVSFLCHWIIRCENVPHSRYKGLFHLCVCVCVRARACVYERICALVCVDSHTYSHDTS